MDRIRFTNGTSMSLLKAEKRILNEGELAIGMMVTFDGACRCGVGVLENWTRSTYGAQTFSRRITRDTRGELLNVNDGFKGSSPGRAEQRALHVAGWLRSQAKR